MDALRPVRFFAVIAIFAMILTAIAPLATAAQMASQAEQGYAMASPSGAMDCTSCPKADMALAGCQQLTCQMAAAEPDLTHFMTSEHIRYRLAAVVLPAEWHTVPPVSPG